MHKKSISVWIEKVSDNEFLQLFSADFSPSIFIHNLNIRCDISGSWLELFVHGSITINKPFSNLNWFTDSVSISIIGFDNFSELIKYLLCKISAFLSGEKSSIFYKRMISLEACVCYLTLSELSWEAEIVHLLFSWIQISKL